MRRELFVAGKEIESVAKLNGQIIRGLVAVWKSDAELELRHLAVASNAQRKGIGQTLMAELLRIDSSKNCHTICTIARNASPDFFRKMGFQTAKQQTPEHLVFQKHGITFEALEITVEPSH
ncbi:MAG: GNAT family N-acetyltransferase [Kiritimatiellia bacterium]